MPEIIKILLSAIISLGLGYFVRKYIAENKVGKAEEIANKIVIDAEHTAESKKKELLVCLLYTSDAADE